MTTPSSNNVNATTNAGNARKNAMPTPAEKSATVTKTPSAPRPHKNKPSRHRRLILELAAVAAVVLAVVAIRFLPWLLAQPVTSADPYADYQKLYNVVASYDYSQGPSATLETRINNALSATTDYSLIQYYYNLKAKGEYYQRTGRFTVAAEAFEEALTQAPRYEEYEYLYPALVKCYRAMGDYEQASKYQAIFDGTYEEETDDAEGTEEVENPEDASEN